MGLLSFLIPNKIFAQSFKIGSVISADTMLVGDQIAYKIGAVGEIKSLKWPNFKDSIGALEIIESLPLDTTKLAPLSVEKTYILSYFDTGLVEIPSAIFTLHTDSILTQQHHLQVLGVKIDSTNAQLYADLSPIKIPYLHAEWMFYFYWGLGIVIAVILLTLLFLWIVTRYRKKQKAIKIITPAHIIAYGELEEFRSKRFIDKGAYKKYYSELSEIIRRYLENRYNILALESTTDEIMDDLKSLVYQSDSLKELEQFLRTSDLVKFAKAIPEEHLHEKFFKELKDFIAITKQEEHIKEESENE